MRQGSCGPATSLVGASRACSIFGSLTALETNNAVSPVRPSLCSLVHVKQTHSFPPTPAAAAAHRVESHFTLTQYTGNVSTAWRGPMSIDRCQRL